MWSRERTIRLAALLLVLPFLASPGCWGRASREVVVYTALDSEFSEPIFADFRRAKGVTVLAKFDTESTKTVSLTEALMAERDRPRCDVFWNNEILHTIRLRGQGLLDVYQSPMAESYPAMYRSGDGCWHGFAARARVLIVNTSLTTEDNRPSSIYDLADSKWRDRAAIAKPLFGTTATHAACLFAELGPFKAKQYFRSLRDNGVQILSGNKQVALAVAAGSAVFGLTDTDDAIIEVEKGMPVAIVYPDQGEGQLGTLFIPNTLGVIKRGPNARNARRLVDYLLSPEVETKLANGPSAQIPLNPDVDVVTRVETPKTVRAMEVDFEKAAQQWDNMAKYMRKVFTPAD
jgi:iron(III) transport system substrate-binding protein